MPTAGAKGGTPDMSTFVMLLLAATRYDGMARLHEVVPYRLCTFGTRSIHSWKGGGIEDG